MSDTADPVYSYREWALMKLVHVDGHTYDKAAAILHGICDEGERRPYREWTRLLGERQ